jgi:hypothetical protein
LQHALVEEAVMLRSKLRDCLAHVHSVLVRAEGALDKLQLVPLLPELQVDTLECVDVCASCESTERELSVVVVDNKVADIEATVDKAAEESFVVGEDCIFGCFFPRARFCLSSQHVVSVTSVCEDIDGIMAPVMRIMAELQKLCGEPSPSLSMVHPQVDSLGTSTVTSTPPLVELSQPLDFIDHRDNVNEAVALASNSARGEIKKVEEYLKSKSKKSVATRKTSAAA